MMMEVALIILVITVIHTAYSTTVIFNTETFDLHFSFSHGASLKKSSEHFRLLNAFDVERVTSICAVSSETPQYFAIQ